TALRLRRPASAGFPRTSRRTLPGRRVRVMLPSDCRHAQFSFQVSRLQETQAEFFYGVGQVWGAQDSGANPHRPPARAARVATPRRMVYSPDKGVVFVEYQSLARHCTDFTLIPSVGRPVRRPGAAMVRLLTRCCQKGLWGDERLFARVGRCKRLLHLPLKLRSRPSSRGSGAYRGYGGDTAAKPPHNDFNGLRDTAAPPQSTPPHEEYQ